LKFKARDDVDIHFMLCTKSMYEERLWEKLYDGRLTGSWLVEYEALTAVFMKFYLLGYNAV
jgi:hypothetical protein